MNEREYFEVWADHGGKAVLVSRHEKLTDALKQARQYGGTGCEVTTTSARRKRQRSAPPPRTSDVRSLVGATVAGALTVPLENGASIDSRHGKAS